MIKVWQLIAIIVVAMVIGAYAQKQGTWAKFTAMFTGPQPVVPVV